MRLICPNCGAQYEVPVDVIPEGGRDVQCSACAHTWFQHHPDDSPELTGKAALEEAIWDTGPEEEDDLPAPAKRQLDPEVEEVLREEAERELRARQAETQHIEMQPDLGLTPPEMDRERRARQARERMAKIKGKPPSSPDIASPDTQPPAKRRDRLPDVDELNQSLRSAPPESPVLDSPEGRHEVAETPPDKSFGGGFLSILVLACLVIGAYVFAPQLSEMAPPLAPYLDTYVAQVDSARAWLDVQVAQLLSSLDSLSSEASAPEATTSQTIQGDGAAQADSN